MSSTRFLSAVLAASSIQATAHADNELEAVVVTATKISTVDTAATFASEVYHTAEIESSSARSLYDFLDQNSSITVLPSYGNPYAQKIDMRGYGIGDGYQNIVVTLNGRRMNNIDMVPQLLSSISLNDIERIEITKGSGSVVYGDGATAGSIQIYTKDAERSRISASLGNYGAQSGSFSSGLLTDYFSLSVSADHAELDGYSATDITGYKDESDSNSSRIMLRLFPSDRVELSIGQDQSRINTRYVGGITLAEFNSDPAQNSGNTYTPQQFETTTTTLGLITSLDDQTELTIHHAAEDKISNYLNGWGRADYDYQSNEIRINQNQGPLQWTAGIQQFDGDRIKSGSNTTTKKNRGTFIQGQYQQGKTTYSMGGRYETVDYTYAPVSGSTLQDDHELSSYDFGINHQLNNQLSLFSNLNGAFQAPDIDRFFNWGGTFNGFIVPAESTTLNFGTNHITSSNKAKLTLFWSELDNEIYYYKSGNKNTNINQSHKYGVELQNRHQHENGIKSSVNYAYTRAIIDREDDGAGSYDGKDLPGVSRHTLSFSAQYKLDSQSALTLSHTYRSSTYAAEDFSNSFSQKQKAYHSTNLSYRYTVKEDLELSAGIDNLFATNNGIWIRDDKIYPVNFTRNWKIGIKLNF